MLDIDPWEGNRDLKNVCEELQEIDKEPRASQKLIPIVSEKKIKVGVSKIPSFAIEYFVHRKLIADYPAQLENLARMTLQHFTKNEILIDFLIDIANRKTSKFEEMEKK